MARRRAENDKAAGAGEVQLTGVWFPVDVVLALAEVDLPPWRRDKPRPKYDMGTTVSVDLKADPQCALRGYRLRFFDPESAAQDQVGLISGVFRLHLVAGKQGVERPAQGGAIPTPEAMFDFFAWPYWRQFVHQTLANAGWPRFGLPLVRPGLGKEAASTARTGTRRAKKARPVK